LDRRRVILAATCFGAVAAFPAAVAQQQGKVWRVGFLMSRSSSSVKRAGYDAIFLKTLRELGYVEGKNIVVEWRFADGKYDRLPGLAAELVQRKADVIVAWAPPSIQAAKQATSTIPIVMTGAGDPVGSGFVASLSRPGGNITGTSNIAVELSVKYLELLQAVVPRLTRVAVLLNPANPSYGAVLRNVQASAKTAGVKLIPRDARTEIDIDTAFGAATNENASALIVAPDGFFVSRADQIVQLADKHRLPTIYTTREYATVGGLMTYGQNLAEHFRLAAVYVAKILKGAKPGDLPVEQPTKLELVLNIRTARRLGLNVSRDFLARVDEVIE
jgi:putative ABC transport system substrate-binding protein